MTKRYVVNTYEIEMKILAQAIPLLIFDGIKKFKLKI